jgi:outer membrane protein assembly factor BamB
LQAHRYTADRNEIVALDTMSGSVRWRYAGTHVDAVLNPDFGPPEMTIGGGVICLTGSGILALDATRGSRLWSVPPDDRDYGAAVVYHDGIIHTGWNNGNDGGLTSRSVRDGTPVMTIDGSRMQEHLFVVDRTLVMSSHDGIWAVPLP